MRFVIVVNAVLACSAVVCLGGELKLSTDFAGGSVGQVSTVSELHLRVGVKGDRDPGYGSTSKMIAEAAVCLLQDAGNTPGGIWTPASAMGTRLITRLEKNAGLRFAVEAA